MDWVIGLGNPGQQYKNTRHNIGFMVLDQLAAGEAAEFKRRWFFRAEACSVKEKKRILIKPQTFMNRSGDSIKRWKTWRRLKTEHLVVVVDDLSLEPGKIRVRKKGRAGGHNGLKSIIAELGTETFTRIRVGIGSPDSKMSVIDYVLSAFAENERQDINQGIGLAAQAVNYLLENGPDKAMNKFN